jgi:hypothetical protein
MRASAAFLTLAAALWAGTAAPAFAAADAAAPAEAAAPPSAGGDFAMPPELIAKLTPEQIVSVLREREMRRATFSGRPADLVGTTLFFGTLLTTVLLAQVFATRRERMRQETLRAIVEKGIEIPPDLVARRGGPACDLRRGLVLVGAGVGLSVLFAVAQLDRQLGSGLWTIGLIPMLMGAGFLAVWRIETRGGTSR